MAIEEFNTRLENGGFMRGFAFTVRAPAIEHSENAFEYFLSKHRFTKRELGGTLSGTRNRDGLTVSMSAQNLPGELGRHRLNFAVSHGVKSVAHDRAAKLAAIFISELHIRGMEVEEYRNFRFE
jgi:hypothetical protein